MSIIKPEPSYHIPPLALDVKPTETLPATLDTHYLLHLNKKQHRCSYCSKCYVQQANLKYHIIAAHENKKPFVCAVCQKSFSQPGNLQTHLAIHQTFRAFACSDCKQSFTQLGNLKSHCKNKHNGFLHLACGICLRTYETTKQLVYHIKHSCRSMNTYSCDLCNGGIFCDATDLNMHLQTVHKGGNDDVLNANKRRRKTSKKNLNLRKKISKYISSLYIFN
ncbi:zinc finger X-chromosomal protein-like isoform X2 [Culicoides brevitarsis]|uniref:zinc finger X-chromosomal protein-like isoform X2 n=1 Tax=Culicoides brevitarsis TaxID=469753 RepID=UPI00307B607F